MTEDEARTAADSLLETIDNKGYRMVFVEAKPRVRYPGEWSVIYDVFSPQGTLIDGPIVVVIDEKSAEARLLEGP